MNNIPINRQLFQDLLQKKIAQVAFDPQRGWTKESSSFMVDRHNNPVVRVAVVSFSPDLDIWQGLRNQALVGRFPLTPADIWEHYAASNFGNIRSDGTPDFLAVPESFEDALKRIRRIVLVSGMLVVNPKIYESYAEKIERGDQDPFDYYNRTVEEVSCIIDESINKFALSLMSLDRAVVPMTDRNAQKITERTRGQYRAGPYHGPCNEHWPQNSIAVMTGLLRFGIHRLPFRDEVDAKGKRRRLYGRYRSIVIFDCEEPHSDEINGLTLLDKDYLARLREINTYTYCDPDIVAERYCTYNSSKRDGRSICGKCIETCPSNALANSSPGPDGAYDQEVSAQKHRFLEEALVFDFENCMSDRNQKAELFDDFVCARCEAICASRGIRKSASEINTINLTRDLVIPN